MTSRTRMLLFTTSKNTMEYTTLCFCLHHHMRYFDWWRSEEVDHEVSADSPFNDETKKSQVVDHEPLHHASAIQVSKYPAINSYHRRQQRIKGFCSRKITFIIKHAQNIHMEPLLSSHIFPWKISNWQRGSGDVIAVYLFSNWERGI